jgi:hypothetical protein
VLNNGIKADGDLYQVILNMKIRKAAVSWRETVLFTGLGGK